MSLQVPRPFKKPETGVYYYRRTVPDDLKSLVGNGEIRRTLRTKDPKLAARRFGEVAREVEAEWAELRRRPHESDDKLAATFVSTLADPDATRNEIMATAYGVMDERDIDPDQVADQKALRRTLERAGLASWLGSFTGDTKRRKPSTRLVEAVEGVLLGQSTPSSQSSPTLTAILEGWWTEAKAAGRKPSTRESYRNTIANLTGFLGHDSAEKVTADDVVRFKEHRLAQGISAKTVKDSDLAGIKTVFGWAVSNRKLASNPAAGLTIKLGKPKKLRGKGLTEEEATALISAALNVQRQGESERTFWAKRWVPVLAAYSGARVGEVAQLRKQDVRQEGGHWLIELTPEAGTIKTNEARKVVLHPHVVELGFPDFARSAPDGHLFLKPSATGDVLGPLQGVKNRLAEFARTVVTDPNVAPLHGLRHRFKTVGMDAGVSTRVLDAIQGHAARTAGDGYGQVTVKAMADAMAKVPRVRQ
jgi:site-specific recombinase XerD